MKRTLSDSSLSCKLFVHNMVIKLYLFFIFGWIFRVSGSFCFEFSPRFAECHCFNSFGMAQPVGGLSTSFLSRGWNLREKKLKKSHGHHHDLVHQYSVCVSQFICNGFPILGLSQYNRLDQRSSQSLFQSTWTHSFLSYVCFSSFLFFFGPF